MTDTYDGIILGAGHNGLILQAYLGKAGLKTLAIERKAVAGGGLATLEDPRHPGFLHNTHAFFQRAITTMPWYADLELERHGARYIEPELNVALITGDGRALEWWTDIERTIASFAAFSKRDAETLRRWHDGFRADRARYSGRPRAARRRFRREEREALLKRSAAGRRLLEVSALSPLEFVHQEFEHPTVQAGLLFFNGLREVDLRVRGFGHHIAALLASPAKAQMSRGGTAALARALEAAVRAVWRRDPRADRAPAHPGRGRARGRRRDRGRRSLPRPSFRRVLAQSAPDISRPARRPARAARRSRSGRRAFSTICWPRCSRSTSICASRRATRRAPTIPSSIAPSW